MKNESPARTVGLLAFALVVALLAAIGPLAVASAQAQAFPDTSPGSEDTSSFVVEVVIPS